MRQPEPISVYWQDNLVGHIVNPQPDMWYTDGVWQPVDGEATTDFLNQHRI
jgi:hypothetical protein